MRIALAFFLTVLLAGCSSRASDPHPDIAAVSTDVAESGDNNTNIYFLGANGLLSRTPPGSESAQTQSFQVVFLGSSARWSRGFTNATTITGANATVWVRVDRPILLHPLFTPWPCSWTMSIQQTPGQNFDTLYPAKCLAEPTGLVLPGTYRLSFEFPAAAFAVDLNRQLLVSVGVAAYDSPETSTVKVLVGSTRYPSQIWLTGSEGRPE